MIIGIGPYGRSLQEALLSRYPDLNQQTVAARSTHLLIRPEVGEEQLKTLDQQVMLAEATFIYLHVIRPFALEGRLLQQRFHTLIKRSSKVNCIGHYHPLDRSANSLTEHFDHTVVSMANCITTLTDMTNGVAEHLGAVGSRVTTLDGADLYTFSRQHGINFARNYRFTRDQWSAALPPPNRAELLRGSAWADAPWRAVMLNIAARNVKALELETLVPPEVALQVALQERPHMDAAIYLMLILALDYQRLPT